MRAPPSLPVRQGGFSLVESLIATMIGLFIVAALGSVLVNNRQAFRVQEAFARVQENARFAIEVTGREIRKAGYRSNVGVDSSVAFPSITSMAAGKSLVGTSTTLTLRYQGSGTPADGSMTDCVGNALAADDTAVVTLSLVGTDLVCQWTVGTVTSSQPLVSGVESIDFKYGWDKSGDGYVDDYQGQANSANSPVSIKFTFTLVADDTKVAEGGDGRLRRTYTQVIALRNVVR